MFESVAPETFVPRSRRLFYESLPMSIAAHGVVGAAILVAATWNVSFPSDSPRMSVAYSIEMLPTPPPPPPAPAQAQSAPKPVVEPHPGEPQEIVAPTVIPDEIPVLTPIEPAVEHSVGEGAAGESVVKGWNAVTEGTGTGDVAGVASGVKDGVIGGVADVPPDTVIVQRHHPLPMSMIPMSMVYPFYPEEARQRGWEDAVTVRYIIGKDGRVKTVEVLDRPQRQLFEKITVNAIRHWRFRPLLKAGVPQEVIHELIIYFKLTA